MRAWIHMALMALAALASCAPAPQVAEKTAADSTKPATCGLKLLNPRVRPGEDMQTVFTVRPDSQWCFDGINLGNTQTLGQAVATAPSHGELRLVRQPGAIVFGYRPAPGYSGADRFRISVPAEIETIYLTGNVTVAP